MGVISTELTEFKAAVGSKLDGMSDACTTLANEIQQLSGPTKEIQSQVDAYYDSTNKSSILKKIGRISEIHSKIATSIESDLMGLVSDAKSVITDIETLDKINEEIDRQQNIINDNSGTDDSAVKARENAQSVKEQKNKEFDELHEATLNKLKALKGKDADISFVQEFSPSNYEANADQLEYGTFELKTFVSSTGVEMEYYIYVPDYGKEVQGLPCMLYMHGSQSNPNYSDWCEFGLTSLIKNKEITPSGIVIMPHVKNHKDTQTLKELTDYIVSEYNCDENRISISGHSSGGIATYRMINAYPGYFSCAIPISGTNLNCITPQSVDGLKVWAFGGSSEGGNGATSTPTGYTAVNSINKNGGEAKFTEVGGGHAGSNKFTYSQDHESPEGEMINPLEWAFQQERA